ncbi:MAG: redoxin domain-containing protein [Gammaproteobacteria bacterium]|nr:redoxin domain-containing protein [Gammaproteobacteria bacterium]
MARNRLVQALTLALAAVFTAGLATGDKAPDFSLQGSDGKTYQLSELLKEGAVVLAWYPKAFTKGCTIECKSLTEKGHLIREYEVTYFMVSVDPLEDVTKFAESMAADFPLLADPDKSVAQEYGVMSPYGFSSRHNVYIGTDGNVLAVDTQVNPETAAEDIAARLGELGIEKRET